MIGAIIGDMVGSIYEFDNIKNKDFLFFSDSMEPTDDSVLTIATADWLLHGGNVSIICAMPTHTLNVAMAGAFGHG